AKWAAADGRTAGEGGGYRKFVVVGAFRCGRLRRLEPRDTSHALGIRARRSRPPSQLSPATPAPRRGPPRHHPVGCSSPGLRIILSTSAMCCSSRVICSRAYSSSHTLLSTTSASRL